MKALIGFLTGGHEKIKFLLEEREAGWGSVFYC